jgi:putative NIF3 family GTP cyclohydrolase 1 type 2
MEDGTSLTVGDIMREVLRHIPAQERPGTVDTLKAGTEGQQVSGIVTTFLATADVIEEAIRLSANLIITHEPTFYNHRDEVDWLAGDPVYEYKKRLLHENAMVVWRLHDYWHQLRPDPMYTGALQDMGWGDSASQREGICTIHATPLAALAMQLKDKLDLPSIRIVGNPQHLCRSIGLLPGAWGGIRQIGFLSENAIDTLIVGEIDEWETCEYVRDSINAGTNKALIILGHANSEEPGMRVLAEWLKPLFPSLRITHVPATDPFIYF